MPEAAVQAEAAVCIDARAYELDGQGSAGDGELLILIAPARDGLRRVIRRGGIAEATEYGPRVGEGS